MEEQLIPKPTRAQKLAVIIGVKSGPNSIFRRVGEPNADITIKYNIGVYVNGLLANRWLQSKSIGFITWKDIPSVLIGRFSYRVWKRNRNRQ